MQPAPSDLFPIDFLIALRVLTNVHHSVYRRIPPYGLLFEALVQESFRWAKKPFTDIVKTGRTKPTYDLLVDGVRMSIKTETGEGTNPNWITITKLFTAEKPPWSAEALVQKMLQHLSGYDVIVMLRAIWQADLIHYQLVEIPVDLLRQITDVQLVEAGRGGRSLAADVRRGDMRLFRVFMDGTDRKCTIRNLDIRECVVLLDWELHIGDAIRIF